MLDYTQTIHIYVNNATKKTYIQSKDIIQEHAKISNTIQPITKTALLS